MALATNCQTPGATYGFRIRYRRGRDDIDRGSVALIETEVAIPRAMFLTEAEAEQLEANVHNALEMVLAPYFREASIRGQSVRSQ